MQSQLHELIEKQGDLAKDLGEAMSQTSETWHDNAPADVINVAGALNAQTAEKLVSVIRDAVVLDYPENEEKVTIGSGLGILFPNGNERTVLLAGHMAGIKEYLAEGVNAVTVKSPIGEALLGAKEGDTVAYRVGARVLEATVNTVSNPRSVFADPSYLDYDIKHSN